MSYKAIRIFALNISLDAERALNHHSPTDSLNHFLLTHSYRIDLPARGIGLLTVAVTEELTAPVSTSASL